MTGRAAVIAALLLCIITCAPAATPDSLRRRAVRRSSVVDDLQARTFRWFWDTTNPANGLVPDRYPTPSFSSVAAVGFGLTAYGIGAERGYVTREEAAERVATTLRFFLNAPHGPEAVGVTGYKGFFYHFLDMNTGLRFEQVELSTIDTTLFLAGALFCQSYFDRDNPVEQEIRETSEELYRRVEWRWAQPKAPLVSMGWHPEKGFIDYEWHGLNEAMILYVLALGSPTHPIDEGAWGAYTETYQWADFYGQPHVQFAPLFGHQYSQVWIDVRGIRDAYMRQRGIDYFENSRRATISQRAYAIDNPSEWAGYGEEIWGLSACDGPIDATLTVAGRPRRFMTYAARGAAANEVRDDGTIAPTAAASSIAFAPEIAIPAIEAMATRYGENLYARYGFLDAFNPTFNLAVKVQHGRVDPKLGWFDTDYLGIDQGPIIAMIENYRSDLVWKTMRKNPHIIRGLRRAGFTGGWLESAP